MSQLVNAEIIPIVKQKIEKKVIQDIRDRLFRRNKNWLSIICGETGSGKSFLGMDIASQIDPTFSIERVVFDGESLMKLLNSGTLKSGDAIIFDEAGVGMPAREWHSVSNKAIGYILQTFRHKNLAVIFTTPALSFVDSQARKLFHAYIEPIKINYQAKTVTVKWLNMSYNSRFDKTYFKYPVLSDGDQAVRYSRLRFHKPNAQLVQDYEDAKDIFTKSLGISVQKDFHGLRLKSEGRQERVVSPASIPVDIAPYLNRLIRLKPTKLTIAHVQNLLGVGDRLARRAKEAYIHHIGA